MTLVKMIETRKGSEDGFTVKQYQRGEIYDIREGLARSFFAAGFGIKPTKKQEKYFNIKRS